jgi:hypothetical protein
MSYFIIYSLNVGNPLAQYGTNILGCETNILSLTVTPPRTASTKNWLLVWHHATLPQGPLYDSNKQLPQIVQLKFNTVLPPGLHMCTAIAPVLAHQSLQTMGFQPITITKQPAYN